MKPQGSAALTWSGRRRGEICRDFYGSDGTRTRDLRRDRPDTTFPGSPGLGGDSRCEQALSSVAFRR
jgi:hypothetical protein